MMRSILKQTIFLFFYLTMYYNPLQAMKHSRNSHNTSQLSIANNSPTEFLPLEQLFLETAIQDSLWSDENNFVHNRSKLPKKDKPINVLTQKNKPTRKDKPIDVWK